MRILLFFDLPVKTIRDKKNYAQFRKYLLYEGFDMIQFSVYCRICNGHESMESIISRIEKNLPPKGKIRVLPITEKQYARTRILLGEKTTNEKYVNTHQLSLF